MTNLTVPGVKIEEISTLPPSVSPVDTAIPAFIGYTEKMPTDGLPQRITSFLEFEQVFGGPALSVEVDVIDNDPPNEDWVISGTTASESNYLLYYSVRLFYENGGGVCYVSSAGAYNTTTPYITHDNGSGIGLIAALDLVAKEDEPTLLLFPDISNISGTGGPGGTKLTNWGTVNNAALSQCAENQDRFTIIDTVKSTTTTVPLDEITQSTGKLGPDNLKYGAAYYPRLVVNVDVPTLTQSNIHIGGDFDDTLDNLVNASTPPFDNSSFVDQVVAAAQAEVDTLTGTFSTTASGAVAGVYARTDDNRGVWKAPANTGIRGFSSLEVLVDDTLQDEMNAPTDGKAVNAIRNFTDRGNIVWGARTLDANSLEWRYVNVRRLFIFIEESLAKAMSRFVFESNDSNTWQRVKAMSENFLLNLWKQGAIVGAKPNEAFFVKVGLGSTMTSEDILNGIMNVEIGIAASRPAEFIVLKFSHLVQTS